VCSGLEGQPVVRRGLHVKLGYDVGCNSFARALEDGSEALGMEFIGTPSRSCMGGIIRRRGDRNIYSRKLS
jgi:hypothetical protein